MDNLYTQKRSAKYRGPSTSEEYNSRIEENYKDLLHLKNLAGNIAEDQAQAIRYLEKDSFSMATAIEYLMNSLSLLVNNDILSFFYEPYVDNARFEGTAFEIADADICTVQSEHGKLTLPAIEETSSSKFRFVDTDGNVSIASNLAYSVIGDETSKDDSSAFVNSTDLIDSIVGVVGRRWERNVVVDNVSPGDKASVYVYISVPFDLSVVSESNCIQLTPYPVFGIEIEEIMYSTAPNPVLNSSDNYIPLNSDGLYEADTDAIGFIPPGGWVGDSIESAAPLKFYFDPTVVTAFRIKLSQSNYFASNSKYVFTYGLSDIDVRFDKFSDTGRTIIRVDAPEATTFDFEPTVTPYIYNISQAELPYVFDYRVIWETSTDSGVYTTSPVSSSEKIWIEITLNKSINGATPELSMLKITPVVA